MPACWIARAKVNNTVEYKKYADLVPPILAKYGGKPLARGRRLQIMEGPEKFQRFVIIEFPTFDQGVACFSSDEYKKAAAFRRDGAGEAEIVMLKGWKRRNDRRILPPRRWLVAVRSRRR